VSTDSRTIHDPKAQGLVGFVNQYGMTVVRVVESRRYGGSRRTFYELRCTCGNTCEAARRMVEHQKGCGCKRRLPEGVAAFNNVYGKYKDNAKKRGLEWSLGEELFREITQRDCVYCGLEPSTCFALSTGTYTYNGVDRINSDLGYYDGNVVPCCKLCNLAKRDTPPAEFEAWLARVTEFRNRTCPPKCPPPE
jgi:hypothetical protein